jgi:hypothetical protein
MTAEGFNKISQPQSANIWIFSGLHQIYNTVRGRASVRIYLSEAVIVVVVDVVCADREGDFSLVENFVGRIFGEGIYFRLLFYGLLRIE